MRRPVRLHYWEADGDGETGLPVGPLLAELASLAPGLEVVREEDSPEGAGEPPPLGRPEIRLRRGAPGGGWIRFAGYPAGFVRLELVEALAALASGEEEAGPGPGEAGAESRAPAERDGPGQEVRIWVSPTCSRCARTVRLALGMVLALPGLSLAVIVATEFPEAARQEGIRTVPTLVAGGRRWLEPPPPRELWEALVRPG
ncbi:MAG: thioredoxin family protein [Bacillota bacterium]|nr:thioredoxin family protein [Bacillota bacterium]